jgi:hypothetical protein
MPTERRPCASSNLVIVNWTTLDSDSDHPRSARQSARFDPATGTWTPLGDLPAPLVSKGNVDLLGTIDYFVATSSAGSAVVDGTTWRSQPTPEHATASVMSEGVISTLTLQPIGGDASPTRNVIVSD